MERTRSVRGCGVASVCDERVQVVPVELAATAEKRQLDHEVDADDRPAELFDEPGDRLFRSPRREHVVVDHDTRSAADRVGCDLEGVLAVFERVRCGDGLGRQLSRTASGHEAAARGDGDTAAEPEPSRLGAEDEIRVALTRPRGQLFDRLCERLSVDKERRDVLEADPSLREVRNLADLALEIDGHYWASLRTLRHRSRSDSSCALWASRWRSASASRRRSGLRERSAGPITASRSPDSRSAAVRKARRFRAPIPNWASASHAAITSTSLSA